MTIQLTITTDDDPGSVYIRSFMQDKIVIGRSRSADICLPAMAVSTRHAEVRIVDADFALVDLESLNGTLVNGTPVLPFRNRMLKNGDVISIASFKIGFQTGATTGAVEPRDTAVLQARDILANVLARSGQSLETKSLYVATGPSRGKRVELPSGPGKLIIGRGKNVDLYLDDADVSRQHAEVVIEAAGVFVRDLRSRNGVHKDGQRVDAVKLALGDQFTLGSSTITLEHPAEKSLGLIFEAPEEDTSSFLMMKERPSAPEQPATPSAGSDRALSKSGEPKSVPPKESPVLPSGPETPVVGPADPLIATPNDGRITGKQKLSSYSDAPPDSDVRQRTDIGLIIVGTLILIAAVGGLIYLFQ